MKSIAIIGAGFSGTMSAIQLMKNAKTPLHIYLIDKKYFARGQAYADISSELLLNVRADHMGAFPEEIGHFYQWLLANNIPATPSDFISRTIYGNYLNELLQSAISDSQALVKIEMINDQVIDINQDKKELLFKTHHSIAVDQLILATGLESPLEFNFSRLKDKSDPVTIIGTGLSMIDVVMHLQKLNYQGKITAVSRRGRLPQSHQFFDSTVPRPNYDFSQNHSLLYVLKTVKQHCKSFEWRLVIDTLRPHVQFLWKNFTIKERGQFLRYLRVLWDTHRHRISPLIYKEINHLIANGKLEIKSIAFNAYVPQTQIVINCSGLTHKKNSFIQNLINKKLIKTDVYQLGVESQTDWIHPIGPLRRGLLWESTAVPELRVQARDLALELLSV